MEHHKVNLVHHLNEHKPSGKAFLAGKFFIYGIVVFGILLSVLTFRAIFSENGVGDNLNQLHLFGQLKQLIGSGDKELRGEKDDRINILLLGIGGAEHEGANLTDTNIIVSLKPSSKEISMLSIPRDFYAPIGSTGVWRKLNNANAIGEADEKGSGSRVAAETVTNVFDIPIHYYIRVDFDGFEKFIDEFGGIDVYVENTLDDPEYPIRGREDSYPLETRFEHLFLEKGWHHMNGSLALKYARSRHGKSGEGSDFARGRRQQKVIAALKDKVFQFGTFVNLKKINNLLSLFNKNVATDLEPWEMLRLADTVKKIDSQKITHHILDDGPTGLLAASIAQDGAYILKPKTGNWSELQYLVKNIFSTTTAEVAKLGNEQALPKEKRTILTVEIRNGTKKNGFAKLVSDEVAGMGLSVVDIGNAEKQDYAKTIIYDLTNGIALEELRRLKETLDAQVALTLPGWLHAAFTETDASLLKNDTQKNLPETELGTTADFLIILGENSIPRVFGEALAGENQLVP